MSDDSVSPGGPNPSSDADEAGAASARRISREERGSPGAFLARASRLLASSLDYETTLRTVAGLALPYFGEWCIVDIVEYEEAEAVMRRLAIVHPDPEKEAIAERLEDSWPPETEDPIGAPVVLRTREPQVMSEVTDRMLRQAARSEQNLRDLRRLGIGSFLVVPLIARDTLLGAMTFISPAEGGEEAGEHLPLAENLAAVCALAIDNARHYREARDAREAAGSERYGRRYAEAIVDTVRTPLLVLDQDLRVQMANRSFYRKFRMSPEKTDGRYIYDVGDGQWENDRLRELLEEILPRDAQFEDFLLEHEFETLGSRTMLLNARRVQRNGGMELILLAIEDVTDRFEDRRKRQRLLDRERAAKEEAERAVLARQQILNIVSHDLRSPLSVIFSSVRLLRAIPAEKRHEHEEKRLDAIMRSAERMNRLIGDLLDISQIEKGRLSIERERVSASDLLDEAFGMFRTRADDGSIELECEAPEDLPPIAADRDRILQVFENLVANALRFTPEGGTVVLRAEAAEGAVRFSVSDTGPGIAEENMEQLFEPYWQAQEHLEGGAGLGLAICKGIVEEHGGRIWAESAPGRGSTFRFTVPMVDGGGEGGDGPDDVQVGVRGPANGAPGGTRQSASGER